MSNAEAKIHILDAAYKPFPTFEEWAAKTSVDAVRWDRYSASLQDRADSSSEALKRAREVVKRAAALDTGAIEGLYEVDRGFTFTVAFETAAWEVELAKKGENVRPLFEAQLHAYDYVLDLATKAEPISEAAIRVLHEVVCKAQSTYRVMTSVGPQEQELVKGRYKVLPNHVRTRDGVDHSYAPVDVTPAEMQRLVEETRTAAFLAAHPVMQAAYAHYALVVIHPFADGNGRVARALASAFTYRAISMPIMILSDQKTPYLDALESADLGNYQTFIDFMFDRLHEAIMLVEETLLGVHLPPVEESLEIIRGIRRPRSEFGDRDINEAGRLVLNALENRVREEVSKIPNDTVKAELQLEVIQPTEQSPIYRRRPIKNNCIRLYIFSVKPSWTPTISLEVGGVFRRYELVWPVEPLNPKRFRLKHINGNDTFEFSVEEAVPHFSKALEIRIAELAHRIVKEAVAELASKVQRANNEQHR